MSRKIKLHSLRFLFQIFSFLADKSGGWRLFVKPKLIIGSLLLSVTAYGQNTPQNTKSQQKQDMNTKQDTSTIREEGVFCYVTETMPQFPGGDAALLNFVSDNLKYPESAIKNDIQGRVILRFIVKADGSIENIQVVRSVSSECDQEAIRVVKKFPKFSKPLQNGKPTSVWFTLPIQFKLNTNQKTTNIYDVVDQMPQFPGGDKELFKFISENLKR